MKKLSNFQFGKISANKKVLFSSISIFLLVLVVLFLVIRHKNNLVHDLPFILESGRLAILTDSSRIGFSVKGDSVSGFQYEIVKAFADTLGLELVVTEENDLKTCMADLKTGNYDIIASYVPITTEWKNEALFSTPVFTSRQVLVQRIEGDSLHSNLITSQLDLANDTIYVPVHSPHKMRLQHLSNEIAQPIHIMEIKDMSTEGLVSLVAKGKIKLTICDELFAQRLRLQYPNINISLPIGFEQQQAWVVHSESPKLLAELNDFLNDFIGSSAYWEIYRKYY